MTEINHVKAAIASLEAEERREALLSEKPGKGRGTDWERK